MIKRQKSALEKWFSFNRHKKRFGAKALQQTLQSVDYQPLKNNRIAGDQPQYTHGSNKHLATHINALKHEFSGQPELLYYHAQLIVLIRREANVKKNFDAFKDLWDQEADFLLQHLNMRWLVAASDTFADHAQEADNQAYAIACSCLINTVKLYETERYLQAVQPTVDSQKLQQLSQQRVDLLGGLSAFAVGTDDTLRNMRWRLDKRQSTAPSYRILMTLFNRLQVEDSVYLRFRQRHTRNKTAWW